MIQPIKLLSYIETYGEHWADNLPENCPPENVNISNGDYFFRLTLNEREIVPEDWFNYLKLNPLRHFSKEQIIYCAGLSMQETIESAMKVKKLPYMKRFNGLAKISIIPEDGVILQTLRDPHHYTWWRTTMCDLAKAEMV